MKGFIEVNRKEFKEYGRTYIGEFKDKTLMTININHIINFYNGFIVLLNGVSVTVVESYEEIKKN